MIASLAEGLRPVYGLEGSLLYSAQAESVFAEYLLGKERRYWAAMEGNELRAALFTQILEGRGEITLAHRLDNALPLNLEHELFRMAIEDLKARGVDGILAEFLPTSALSAWEVFVEEGFQRVHRHVLEVPLSTTHQSEPRTRPLLPSDECNAAACLVAAYSEDPGRLLHREVECIEHAQRFVGKVLRGGFGAVTPGMNLCLLEEGEMAGVALGCLLAPGIGFTLQVATLPGFRGHGIGKALLLAQHQAFVAAGCNRASLAVTAGNKAAEGLYARLGYQTTVAFDTHVWRRAKLV